MQWRRRQPAYSSSDRPSCGSTGARARRWSRKAGTERVASRARGESLALVGLGLGARQFRRALLLGRWPRRRRGSLVARQIERRVVGAVLERQEFRHPLLSRFLRRE